MRTVAEVYHSALTRREQEIVDLIAQGNSNLNIAAIFEISDETVKRHVSNIFAKVGVSSRLDLAVGELNRRYDTLDIPAMEARLAAKRTRIAELERLLLIAETRLDEARRGAANVFPA